MQVKKKQKNTQLLMVKKKAIKSEYKAVIEEQRQQKKRNTIGPINCTKLRQEFIRKVCTLEAKVPAPRDIHSLDELIDHSIRLNWSIQEDSCLTSSGHNEKKKQRRHDAVCGNSDLASAYWVYSVHLQKDRYGELYYSP